jgi:hypothetical protein
MFIIPAAVSLAFLWWNGQLSWMCWVVTGVSVFAWLCGRTVLTVRNDLQRGVTSDVRVFRFWELVASVAIWVQWIVCTAGVILALVIKRG